MATTINDLKKVICKLPSNFLVCKVYEQNVQAFLFYNIIRSGKEIDLSETVDIGNHFFAAYFKYRDFLRRLVFDCFVKVRSTHPFHSFAHTCLI
jgi:hypothetical protein